MRVLKVHLGGTAPLEVALKTLGGHIDARIDPAAAAESLEAQHGLVARNHGIQIGRDWLEEMRADDLAEHEQHLRCLARMA